LVSTSTCKYLTAEQQNCLALIHPLSLEKKLSRQEIANLIKGLENLA